MNRLAQLRKPLDQMSSEELHELARHIRADRKLVKERPKEKVKKARSKDKDRTTLAALLDEMSPEERAAFFGENGDDAADTPGHADVPDQGSR